MAQQVRTSPTVATGPVTLGDAGPLGLSGFALTLFVLSVVNAGIIDAAKYTTIIVGVAVFYGGLALLLAGAWEFRAGNTFGATAFTSYGAFWLSYAAMFVPALGIKVGSLTSANQGVGWYLLGWTIITAILAAGAVRINGAMAAFFVGLFLTLLCLTIFQLNGASGWSKAGGWLGIVTAAVAGYTALAGILRSTSGGKMQLPIFPMS